MSQCPQRPRRRPTDGEAHPNLLESLVIGHSLDSVVPAVLDILERDPLAAAACFPGDLLRGLMEVPSSFWAPDPGLYERYLAVVRAGAAVRRRLPPEQRMAFWAPLDAAVVRCAMGRALDDAARSDPETARG